MPSGVMKATPQKAKYLLYIFVSDLLHGIVCHLEGWIPYA